MTGLRILAACNVRHGGNDDSYVRAFRRAGHSVLVAPPESYLPRWESPWLRALRRGMRWALVDEYNRALIAAARTFKPDLLFVFKGESVAARTVDALRSDGVAAINFYPDTGFDGCAAEAIARYDWVFTSKPAQIELLRARYGYERAAFVPHAYDPEVHAPAELSAPDAERYGCDVVFIGNISRKKEETLVAAMRALPGVSFKIWGAGGWRGAQEPARGAYQDGAVWGQEYAKAILGAKICLGLLYEGGPAAPAGDVVTARTFEVPATGGFMLHERTDEAMRYFKDEEECAFFDGVDDLVAKIRRYLADDAARRAISEAGRRRAQTSGYAYDDRAALIVAKCRALQDARGGGARDDA